MKNFLLATTGLVATAGFAAAEVTLSGDARMGIKNDFVYGANVDDSTTFTSRARVSFGLSGESDAGFTFGASFRADNASAAASGTAGSVFLSMNGLTVSMGDVDGAAAAAVGQVDGVGLTGLGDHNEIAYIANGGLAETDVTTALDFGAVAVTADPSVLVSYAAGDATFYVSATKPNHRASGAGVDNTPFTANGEAYAVGAAYTIGNYKVSAGYERLSIDGVIAEVTGYSTDIEHFVLGGEANFGAVTVKSRYGNADVRDTEIPEGGDLTQMALSATYTAGAMGFTLFVSDDELSAGQQSLETKAIGLGASYDLGGGAALKGGIVKNEITATGFDPDQNLVTTSVDDTALDLGLSFSF